MPKICKNVSKIPLFLVPKTGSPKRIFLIIDRYDYCNEYSKIIHRKQVIAMENVEELEQGVPLISTGGG